MLTAMEESWISRPSPTPGWLPLALGAVLLLVGCYPKRIGPPGPDGERSTWAAMDQARRMAHMRRQVVPRAAAVFRAWRPERYRDFDCATCHGPGAAGGDYRMPTDHLPRLSGEVLLGPEFERHPDTTDLKLDRLVPEMAEALGVSSFSIITRSGFGCYSCHLGPDGPMFGN